MITEATDVVQTSDGYVFYRQSDGTYADATDADVCGATLADLFGISQYAPA